MNWIFFFDYSNMTNFGDNNFSFVSVRDKKHFGQICSYSVEEPIRSQWIQPSWWLLVYGQVLVNVRPAATLGELCCRVTFAVQYPLGGQKSFDANGTTRVYPGCADAHLSAWKRNKIDEFIFKIDFTQDSQWCILFLYFNCRFMLFSVSHFSP